jgi:type VI secretion system protein VasD
MALYASLHTRLATILMPLALLPILCACAKPPAPPVIVSPAPPPPPTVLQIDADAATNANPDSHGRASPVVVRLLELKSLAAFQNADFFSLFERDKETLSNDLVAKDEIVLRPGDRRELKRELNGDTRFIGVVAAYRDIEHSRWRASMPVRLHRTTPVSISVQEQEIIVTSK